MHLWRFPIETSLIKTREEKCDLPWTYAKADRAICRVRKIDRSHVRALNKERSAPRKMFLSPQLFGRPTNYGGALAAHRLKPV